jgi:3',5'-cyclic AMP phosphodiesterase CpdA
LLHISDVHFGPPHRPELDDAIRVLIVREKPDALLVSGDLTQRATRAQFEAARDYFRSLSLPQVIVPGNHDVPLYALHQRLFTPFKRYRAFMAEDLEPALKLPGAWIFGMNTAHGWTGKNGIFRAEALGRMADFFAAAPEGVLRVVVEHHHLLPAPGAVYDPVARRSAAAAVALSEAKVDLVVAGHLHHAFVNRLRSFRPAAVHGTVVAHSGTSMSSRGRGAEHEANSVNLIVADEEVLTIDNLRSTGGDGLFLLAARYQFPRTFGKPVP